MYPATAAGKGDTAATQDLLTGGIGKTGLAWPPPAYADPANPTAAELRRNALYSNYRGHSGRHHRAAMAACTAPT